MEEKIQKVRDALIERVKNPKKFSITYSELNEKCKLGLNLGLVNDRNIIAEILGEISIEENKNNRPLLTSIVIHKGETDVGNGFYKLAEKLGKFKKGDDKIVFLTKTWNECLKYWKDKN